MKRGKNSEEHLVGLIDGGSASQSHLRDQAVLEGTPRPLDTPLGLGGVGEDELNAQLLQGSAELGGITPAAQLFLQGLGLFGRVLENAMPVAV